MQLGHAIYKVRNAANLTQAHKPLKNGERVLLDGLVGIHTKQSLLNAAQLCLVKLALHAFHLGVYFFFGTRRQVFGHLLFGTAQQEGLKASSQAVLALSILTLIKTLLEVGTATQYAGHGEGHE